MCCCDNECGQIWYDDQIDHGTAPKFNVPPDQLALTVGIDINM